MTSLYRMHFGEPRNFWLVEEQEADLAEMPDPYPFALHTLPSDLRRRCIEGLESGSPLGLIDLIEAGVTRLYWRQPLKYIMDPVSREVADSLVELSDGGVTIAGTIILADGPDEREYCVLDLPKKFAGPLLECADLSRSPELTGLDHREVMAVVRQRRSEELETTVWLPESILDIPRVLTIRALGNQTLANGKFVEAWNATPISRQIRELPWEFDFHFEPLAAQPTIRYFADA